MKKNKVLNILNISLVIAIFYMFLTINVQENTIKQKYVTKKLSTNLFSVIQENKEEQEPEEIEEIVEEEPKEETEQEEIKNISTNMDDKVGEESAPNPEAPPVIEETNTSEEVVENVPTYTGKFSYYYATCTGCSGITATGVNVSDGKIYYEDSEYGKIRIIAAGPEIPKWSVVRINNTTLGSNVLAIVLDRGGDIGEGRKFLIDILTNTTENLRRTNADITVEVLREGK